ncbi:MAG: class I SAM-dependent methyltransferase [Anaerolineales bacterium]|nr:MAG: class I SAM-dependent methyltransferase [Anaerolineales bacterium]
MKYKLSEAINLYSTQAAMDIAKNHILQKANSRKPLQILEAGCGRGGGIDLNEIQCILTGVDLDEDALNLRGNQQNDLDVAILADLRTVTLTDDYYDIVVSNYVLEHVDGAEDVLKNFTRWLKHGGLMILVLPNRDSGYGFVTRTIPFMFHIFYKKYIQGIKNAGKPGVGPYPVYFDKVVSRNGIYSFCENYGLIMKAEYRIDGLPIKKRAVWFLARAFLWALYLVSFGRLTFNHRNLFYIIEKP